MDILEEDLELSSQQGSVLESEDLGDEGTVLLKKMDRDVDSSKQELSLDENINIMEPSNIRSTITNHEFGFVTLEGIDDFVEGLLLCDISLNELTTFDWSNLLQINGDASRVLLS